MTETIAELHERLTRQIRGETDRDHRKLGNNTYGRIDTTVGGLNAVTIRYHDTDIAEFTSETATYRTGGWWTFTTKERINRYLPQGMRLGSDRGIWYLSTYLPWTRFARFRDEITLRDGPNSIEVDGGPMLDDPDRELRKAITKYVNGYTDDEITRLIENARASGANGDCMFCQFGGERGMGGDHLLLHVAEDYRMVTLAANAIQQAGYKPEIYLGTWGPHWRSGDTIRRCIRKMLKTQLLNQGLTLPTEEELCLL